MLYVSMIGDKHALSSPRTVFYNFHGKFLTATHAQNSAATWTGVSSTYAVAMWRKRVTISFLEQSYNVLPGTMKATYIYGDFSVEKVSKIIRIL